MPVYSYLCHRCDENFEIVQNISNYDSNQKCPTCKKADKVFRDYQSDNVSGNVAKRTLGALAEKNASKMSEDEKQHLFAKHNEYRMQPKGELPAGMERINKDKPFHDQPRNKKPKRKISV